MWAEKCETFAACYLQWVETFQGSIPRTLTHSHSVGCNVAHCNTVGGCSTHPHIQPHTFPQSKTTLTTHLSAPALAAPAPNTHAIALPLTTGARLPCLQHQLEPSVSVPYVYRLKLCQLPSLKCSACALSSCSSTIHAGSAACV